VVSFRFRRASKPLRRRLSVVPAVAVMLAATGIAVAETDGFSVAPVAPVAGEEVAFVATDSCIPPVVCAWSGDGGLVGVGREIGHTYATAGSYGVTLTVDDPGDTTPAVVFEDTVAVTEANGDPVAAFDSSTSELAATFDASDSSDPDGDSLSYAWDFGDGTAGDTARVGHTYSAAGTYTVTLTVGDGRGGIGFATREVRVGTAPTASFTVLPERVVAGDMIHLTSTATDPDAGILDERWDLDGDGDFDDATGTSAEWRFAAAGTFTVGLRVQDEEGNSRSAFLEIEVLPVPPPVVVPPQPTATPTPGAPVVVSPQPTPAPAPVVRAPRPVEAGSPPARVVKPFPSLRVAGRLTARGAVFRLVRLNAPRKARVVTVCRGRGCSSARRAFDGGRRLLRHLQRSYRAGAVIEIRVTRRGYIGKYTRIVVRRGRPPSRRDLCLFPNTEAPRRCPSR